MPPEPVAIMLLVFEALEALGIPYLLGGSMASAVHGVYRATADADLVADLRVDQVEPLVARLGPIFYIDGDDVRDAITRQRSFNVVHLDTMFKVDIFVRKERPFDQAQFARRVLHIVVTDPERTIYVASAEDTDHQWSYLVGVLRTQDWQSVQTCSTIDTTRKQFFPTSC